MKSEELEQSTCAGIVLYNPEIKLLKKNINALINQVDKIFLVDNGSKNKTEIDMMYQEYNENEPDKIRMLENGFNLGIAGALNQILDFAEKEGYTWYISMDQDSCCSENMVEEYAKQIRNSTAILSPYVLNNGKETVEEYMKKDLPESQVIQDPVKCITSGTLNRVSAIKEIGGYNDKLFIDCVDIDLNLRLLVLNYNIVQVNTAYMIQNMGVKKEVKIISKLYDLTGSNTLKHLRYTPVYNPTRLYYISRNSKYVWKKYGKIAGKRMSPLWMTAQYLYYFLTYPVTYNKFDLIKNVLKGNKDAAQML